MNAKRPDAVIKKLWVQADADNIQMKITEIYNEKRPLSWSAISSFEYSPQQWYDKYVLNLPQPITQELLFGKYVGEALASDPSFRPDVPRLNVFELPLKGFFIVPLIGYVDSFTQDAPRCTLAEYKTGKKPWDQKRADEHGQIDMYLLLLWQSGKVLPENVDCLLVWMPTCETSDFSINFVQGEKAKIFQTKRTMRDLMRFGQRIETRLKEMELYANSRKEIKSKK